MNYDILEHTKAWELELQHVVAAKRLEHGTSFRQPAMASLHPRPPLSIHLCPPDLHPYFEHSMSVPSANPFSHVNSLIHLLWARLQLCVWVLKHKLDVLLHHCRHLAHFTSPKCLHNLHWKSQADSLHVKSPFNPATVNGAAWFNAFAAFTGSLCRRNAEAEATACWSRRMRILRKRIRKNINITIIMNMSKWKWCQCHCSGWDNFDKAIKHFQIMPNNQKKPIKCPRFPWQWNTSWEVIGGTSPTGELLLEVRKARIFCTCPSCPCNKRIMPQRKRTPEFARDCNNPNNSKATSSTIQKTILNGGPAKFPTWIHSYLCFY